MKGRVAGAFAGLIIVVALASPGSSGASDRGPGTIVPGTAFRVAGTARASHDGNARVVVARNARNLSLDRARLGAALPDASAVRSNAASRSAADSSTLALPAPDGSTQRFEIAPVEVMAPRLAAEHPEIQTYAGSSADDPGATVRITRSPLGFQASVRGGELGAWYIDPVYHRDQSLYASYFGRELVNRHGPLTESAVPGGSAAERLSSPSSTRSLSAGATLHTYRLALLSDPGYAQYFGAANVTAAKVALVNRVDQIYEDEVAVRLVLIAANDGLNLNTYADAIAPNGPCGTEGCYTRAEITSCGGSTLDRSRYVAGQIVGAESFDVGHLALGQNGGGIASIGVAGRSGKAQGCTGIPKPEGDFYAVDYVAHEMGHQFAANHTFNGDSVNCGGGNRSSGNSVEPGGGSSIMAYAGICGQDNLQPHSDPYFSQRSFGEITSYVNSNRGALSEVQTAALRHFGGGDEVQVATLGPGFTTTATSSAPASSFKIVIGGITTQQIGGSGGAAFTNGGIRSAINDALATTGSTLPPGTTATVSETSPSLGTFTVTYGGGAAGTEVPNFQLTAVADCNVCFSSVEETRHGGTNDSFKLTYGAKTSTLITRGTNYTASGLQAALAQILPVGATATVRGFGGASLDESGFEVDLGGTLQGQSASLIGLTAFSPGASGFVSRTDSGGPARNKGAETATGNAPPVVSAPSSYKIPYRTPFTLTGSATDPNSDPLAYMWEQNDTSSAATKLVSPTKRAGALFRQFGTRLDTSVYDERAYDSPGENHTTADPSRTFPDMAQILANNTDARTGDCPGAPAPTPPSSGGASNVPDDLADCYSEFLPTAAYSGPMHFRLSARDGSLGGGGVGSDDTTVRLARGTGPFLVTSPNAAISWRPGSSHTVKWDVAGTRGHGINAKKVRISLSTDGGESFPTTLASRTKNDGSRKVTLPNTPTSQARIKVKARGNVFFDLSDADFSLAAKPAVKTDAPKRGLVVRRGGKAKVTVSATDADSPGSSLRAKASGLPRGFKVKRSGTTGGLALPGAATFIVSSKRVRSSPGRYHVAVTVDNGSEVTGVSVFDILVKKRTHKGQRARFAAE